MQKRLSSFSVILSAAALLLAGCVSPPTGRVRDAHLLWADDPGARQISAVSEFGPFHEKVTAASGAERISYRPFLYTSVADTNQLARREEILWPLYESNRRGDSLSWRFLLFFGQNTANSAGEKSHDWIFPFWFHGRTRAGEDYAAFFPFYGTVRDIWWDRIHFAAFPLWVEYDRAGYNTWSVLWPFISRTTGESGSGYKVLPFYGKMDHANGDSNRFILWPIWTQGEYAGRNPGWSWMLFPLAGRVERESQSTLMFLPPLFNFTNGKGKLDHYRSYSCPWPLVRIVDTRDSHQRYFWPFYGKTWRDDGAAGTTAILWPFYKNAFYKTQNREVVRNSFFPIYFHSLTKERGEIAEDFTRVWPLYSNRSDPGNSFTRLPDLSFSKREGPLERNLLDIFTLYTRGETQQPKQVAHSALWGMFQRRRGEAENGSRVWPFWSSTKTSDGWRWSILGGLIGREKTAAAPAGGAAGTPVDAAAPARWRILWFF
jgi:hypothetical protein